MFATIAQMLSIWLAAASLAALSVGAVLGALPAAPDPDGAYETEGCHAGCGAGR